jgi:uncharacterized membrane protein
MLLAIGGILIRYIIQWAKIFSIVIVVSLTFYLIGLLQVDPVLQYLENNSSVLIEVLKYLNYISYTNVVFSVVNVLITTFPLVWLVRIILNHVGTKEKS